jgi:hypothetical protein
MSKLARNGTAQIRFPHRAIWRALSSAPRAWIVDHVAAKRRSYINGSLIIATEDLIEIVKRTSADGLAFAPLK